MKKKEILCDFLLWILFAILLGLTISFSFLPLLSVNPFQALTVMFSETFSSTYNIGNILIKTAPLILRSPIKRICIILERRGSSIPAAFVHRQYL